MRIIVLGLGVSALLLTAGHAAGTPKTFKLSAVLTAAEEKATPPIAPANARGTFSATVNLTLGTITWQLTYSGLSGPNFGSHIHLGKRGVVNNRPFIDLCGTQLSTAGKPCKSGRRTTFNKNTPIYREDLATLASKPAYVQIHTGKNPSGELRGQLRIVR